MTRLLSCCIACIWLAASPAPTPLSAQDTSDAGPGMADGPVALVTGSTGGLGREVALRLGASGFHVIVHGRNVDRGMEVVREIEAGGEGTAVFHAADLASYAEVRELAATVLREYDRLDVLVNNAGIWLEPEDGRVLSADGHELHFQVNYLSGFLLTHLLLPRLEGSGPARIVNVASAAQRPIDFDNVMLEEGYSDGRAYSQSKLAQVMFTFDLAEALAGTDLVVVALHPATFMDTDMVLSRGAQPRSSVEDGAEAVVNLIRASDVESGTYYSGLSPARANDQAYDAEARDRLRELSRRLTGLEGG